MVIDAASLRDSGQDEHRGFVHDEAQALDDVAQRGADSVRGFL